MYTGLEGYSGHPLTAERPLMERQEGPTTVYTCDECGTELRRVHWLDAYPRGRTPRWCSDACRKRHQRRKPPSS